MRTSKETHLKRKSSQWIIISAQKTTDFATVFAYTLGRGERYERKNTPKQADIQNEGRVGTLQPSNSYGSKIRTSARKERISFRV